MVRAHSARIHVKGTDVAALHVIVCVCSVFLGLDCTHKPAETC